MPCARLVSILVWSYTGESHLLCGELYVLNDGSGKQLTSAPVRETVQLGNTALLVLLY
jgi:hypothetical protein